MNISQEYILARRVLLDFLEAMVGHRDSLVLVGSQSLYFHINPQELEEFPLYTNDGDVIIDTSLLADDPRIEEALQASGFTQSKVPGTDTIMPGAWHGMYNIPIDIMVTRSQSNRTKPNARTPNIAPHDQFSARTVDGLEGALIDFTHQTIKSYESSDKRSFTIRIAGPTALLIAKLIKIKERNDQFNKTGKNRLQPKDALDIYRLLSSVNAKTFHSGLSQQLQIPTTREYCTEALTFLQNEGTDRKGVLSLLLSRMIGDQQIHIDSFIALAREVLSGIDQSTQE